MFFKMPMYMAAFLMDLAQGSFFLVASLAAAMATDRAILIGLMGTLHYGVKILFSVFFGRLSDQMGRRFLLIIACSLNIVALLVLVGPARLDMVFLSFFLAGITSAMFWPLIEAWIGDGASGEELLMQVGRFNIAFSIGMLSGPLVAGWAMTYSTFGAIIFGVVILGVIIGLILNVKEPSNHKNNIPEQDVGPVSAYVYIGWIANFGNFIAVGLVRMLFPKIGLSFGFTSLDIGVLLATFYFAWLVAFSTMVKFRSWQYRPLPLYAMQCTAILGFFILYYAASFYVFALGLFLFGLCVGMTYFSSLFYCQDGQGQKGHKSGYHEVFLGTGMLIGPFFGGILADQFSLQSPFLFCIAAVGVVMIVQLFILRGDFHRKFTPSI